MIWSLDRRSKAAFFGQRHDPRGRPVAIADASPRCPVRTHPNGHLCPGLGLERVNDLELPVVGQVRHVAQAPLHGRRWRSRRLDGHSLGTGSNKA